MNPIQKLAEELSRLPGIGPRQAKRLVYFLLTQRPEFLRDLSNAVATLQSEVAVCGSCMRFFQKGKKASAPPLCPICSDSDRDRSMLCVVARDVDLDNMEKTKSYEGMYFVLGGTVPILEREPEKMIRERELLALVDERGKAGILKEVIFAMNADPEGESTQSHLSMRLSPLKDAYSLKFSTLGRGLSTGSELEYADSTTLKNALKNRQ